MNVFVYIDANKTGANIGEKQAGLMPFNVDNQ